MRRHKEELNDGSQDIERIRQNIIEDKKRIKRRKRKKILKRFLILLLIIGIGASFYYYNSLPVSKVNSIIVEGNTTYNDDEIINKAKISTNNPIYLTYSPLINRNLNDILGVESTNVTVNYIDRVVKIGIKEYNIIAYSNNTLVYEDGSTRDVEIVENKDVPHLFGFDMTSLPKDLIENLNKMDSATYGAISEIHLEPTKYEPDYVKLVMDNQYFIYSNFKGLPLLNENYATIIRNNTDNDKRCIYIHNEANEQPVAVLKKCD